MTVENRADGDDYNPFQVPESLTVDGSEFHSSEEFVRTEHIAHEASVKSIGTLYFIGAILFFIGVVALAFGNWSASLVEVLALAVAGLMSGAMAFGFWKLKIWARWLGVLFAVPGLIIPPLSTLINVYILYLLLSRKGAMVFSTEYRKIIEATPHIKYQTSKIMVVLLFLLLAIILLGIGAAIFA